MARFQRSDDRRVIYLFITGFLYNDLHILERTINVKQFVTEMVQTRSHSESPYQRRTP